LLVLNHDVLAPGAGFDEHRHSGVDLVTYVVSGALAHHDSSGHSAVVAAGEVQVLRSGAGVTHSERNASDTEPVEYVQMWLRSDDEVTAYGLPSADNGAFVSLPHGVLREVVVRAPGESVALEGQQVLAYVLSGELVLGAQRVAAGDAVLAADAAAAVLSGTGAEARVLVWQLFEPPRPGARAAD
jgi:redox-sensitive bicupin YhaK (pirin superfamily)